MKKNKFDNPFLLLIKHYWKECVTWILAVLFSFWLGLHLFSNISIIYFHSYSCDKYGLVYPKLKIFGQEELCDRVASWESKPGYYDYRNHFASILWTIGGFVLIGILLLIINFQRIVSPIQASFNRDFDVFETSSPRIIPTPQPTVYINYPTPTTHPDFIL
jgi:hypothetical protein